MDKATMHDGERDALQAATELLLACPAEFRTAEHVTVSTGTVTIAREVAIFVLSGHASAAQCYAWLDPAPNEHTVHHRVVLHGGPVKSASAAVWSFFLLDTPVVHAGLSQAAPGPPDR